MKNTQARAGIRASVVHKVDASGGELIEKSQIAMTRPVQKGTVLTLLVEANGLVRFKLTGALEREGYGVVWAATVEEAVKGYERYHIDLLLLDLNRPLKEGCDVLERLSALNRAMPIVILTHHKSEFEQLVAGRVGAILQKPIRVSSLIHTMNLLLGQAATTQQAHRVLQEPISNHAA